MIPCGLLFLPALCLFMGTARGQPDPVVPGSLESHHNPVEAHHSVQKPFDMSTAYWRFGGYTVMTDKLVRLTPATQSRSGYLWNDYHMMSDDWEVELAFKITGSKKLGGDGFGFWVLDKQHTPQTEDSSQLAGPLFGLIENFKGFGVLFDTYDNDRKRDNPTVFVLSNPTGDKSNYDPSKDYRNDMVTSASGPQGAYKCTVDIRNSEEPIKALIRYVNSVLHVYINTKGSYDICLSVNVNTNFEERPHIAVTAHTGEVSDTHDIISITTRYIDEKDPAIDDDVLNYVDSHVAGTSSRFEMLGWFLVICISFLLMFQTIWEIAKIREVQANQMNPVYLAEQINTLMFPHYGLQLLLTIIFLLNRNWMPLILNIPLAAFRIIFIYRGKTKIEPTQLSTAGDGSYNVRLFGSLAAYVILTIYYLYHVTTL